jgi:hypothetical protein
MGDRGIFQWNGKEILLGPLNGLPDGVSHLAGLAKPDTHCAGLVTHYHEGAKAEPTPSFHHLRHPINVDDPILQLRFPYLFLHLSSFFDRWFVSHDDPSFPCSNV